MHYRNHIRKMIFQHIFTLILAIALVVTLAIASGYATNAAAHVDKIKKAHNILTAASVIGWVSIAFAILGFIASVVFAEEFITMPWLRLGLTMGFYAILFATLLIGILLAYSSSIIHSDDNYGANKRPYSLALHGAIVSITLSGSLIVIFIGVKVYTAINNHSGSGSSSDASISSLVSKFI